MVFLSHSEEKKYIYIYIFLHVHLYVYVYILPKMLLKYPCNQLAYKVTADEGLLKEI